MGAVVPPLDAGHDGAVDGGEWKGRFGGGGREAGQQCGTCPGEYPAGHGQVYFLPDAAARLPADVFHGEFRPYESGRCRKQTGFFRTHQSG